MNIDIFRSKIAADKGIHDLFQSDAECSEDYARELKEEIDRMRERLGRFEAAYEVYHGFHKMGLDQWDDIAKATYDAALAQGRKGDKDAVIALLKDADAQGYIPAKTALAKAYIYGEYGVARHPKAGILLLHEAADEGDPEACLLFTKIHEDYPRLVGPDVALEMCQKAAAMDYAPAMERLEKPFDRSEETNRLLERLEAGEKGVAFWLSTRGDLSSKEREEYFYRSLEEGDPLAELEMGHSALREKDEAKAWEYYKKASEHGSGPATFALVNLLLQGKAPFWKGPQLPDVNDPKYQEALELVRHAAEIGDNRGLCVLGRCYVRGYMVERDYEAAKPLLEKALAQGEEDTAPQMLAEIYENSKGEGTATKAVVYYVLSAGHGNFASMKALARIYSEGLREVEADPRKAMHYSSLISVQW